MPWMQITIDCAGALSDRASVCLEQIGALAVTVTPLGAESDPNLIEVLRWERVRLTGLFRDQGSVEAAMGELQQRLAGAPIHFALAPLADRDWPSAWMSYFKPIKLGARLWIHPSWEAPPILKRPISSSIPAWRLVWAATPARYFAHVGWANPRAWVARRLSTTAAVAGF